LLWKWCETQLGHKDVKRVKCGLMCLQALVEGQRKGKPKPKPDVGKGLKDFGKGVAEGFIGG